MKSATRKETGSKASRSILEFFPLSSSHKESTPSPTTTLLPISKPATTWRTLTTPSAPAPPIQTGPENTDLYLSTFETVVKTVTMVAGNTFTSEEGEELDKFWGLSNAAKVLFVRLINRKGFWYYLRGLEYGVEVDSAAKELLEAGLAIGVQDALFGSSEVTYELVKSLRKSDLQSLLSSSKALLIQLTGEDHPDCPLPTFPKPEKNPIYYAYRLLQPGETKEKLKLTQTDMEELFQNTNNKPKGMIASLLFEYICAIKAKIGDFNVEWRLMKRREMHCEGSGGELWVDSVIPGDFPAVISIKSDSFRLFTRIIATFGFFHPKCSFDTLIFLRMSESYTPSYDIPPCPPPLYTNSMDIQLSFEAYLFENALESLHEYHYSKETEGKIVEVMAEIALGVIADDSIGYIQSLQSFLLVYAPQTIISPWKSEYSPPWRWARVAHYCLPYLEKAANWCLVTTLLFNLIARPYYSHRRGLWWERLILDTHRHLRDESSAKSVAALALRDPYVRTGKRVTIEKQASRLGIPPLSLISTSDSYFTQFVHPNYKVVTITASYIQGEAGPMYIGDDSVAMRVEEYAIWWYSRYGWKGFHCENALFRAVFGVLLWPVLYGKGVEGTFVHKYQAAPLDYKSEGFYEARRSEFEEELGRLERERDIKGVFVERFNRFQGYPSAYVDWDQVSSWGLSSLTEILGAIPRTILIRLLSILAQDFKFTNHGLPDLLLWTPHQVQLVEVKSHHDKLADHQKLWIQRLADMGLRVELLHVLNGEYSGT